MDDLTYGTRDKRGNWSPSETLEVAPFWIGKFSQIGRWLIGYIWPWNIFFMAITLAYWYFVLPDWDVMRNIEWGWGLRLLAVNALGIFVLYGAIELLYYKRKKQETRFKFNHKFPSETPSDIFWFKSQNIDNFLRTFLISIPIWTLIEIFALWYYANGMAVWLPWGESWVWLAILLFLAPAIHEVHFFCVHWLIHQGVLYKWIHSIHHNSNNPSPWSSMSMHPIESAFFFSEILWHLILPSNPLVALFQLNSTAYGAVVGHIGFDRLELGGNTALKSNGYAHYLHHKYFEVNYGADGIVPLDKWFGTWHDGSKEADEKMKARFRAKKQRKNA